MRTEESGINNNDETNLMDKNNITDYPSPTKKENQGDELGSLNTEHDDLMNQSLSGKPLATSKSQHH